MNARRLAEIYARRERLLARSAAQRDELALLLTPFAGPLAVADRGVAVVAYVRAHPGAVALAVAVFVVLSPRRAFRWSRRAYAIWRGYRWASRAIRELAPARRSPAP